MPEQEKPKTPKPVEGERIAKVLSRAGVASRREAERMIELGEVKVNGRVITSPALNVTAKDRITVRGEPLAEKEPVRLWLYYKPEGLVTSASDEKGRETVFDTLPEEMPRVMSIGRLDLNSEGLLLLTNDGGLKRRLELPSTGWLRKYRVRVHGNPTDPDLDPLRQGIVVDGERFQPMQVVLDRVQGANAWLTVGLREGKNREIRRAMTEIGLTVNRLIRVSYGPFRLNDLQPGQVEEVRPRTLKDQLGFDPNGDETPEPAKRSTTAKPGRKPATAPKAGVAPKSAAAAKRPARPAAGTAGARLLDSAERFMDGPRKFTAKPRTEKPRTETDRGPTAPRRSAGPKPTGPKPSGTKPAGPRPSGPKPTRPKR